VFHRMSPPRTTNNHQPTTQKISYQSTTSILPNRAGASSVCSLLSCPVVAAWCLALSRVLPCPAALPCLSRSSRLSRSLLPTYFLSCLFGPLLTCYLALCLSASYLLPIYSLSPISPCVPFTPYGLSSLIRYRYRLFFRLFLIRLTLFRFSRLFRFPSVPIVPLSSRSWSRIGRTAIGQAGAVT
jgi:hypothetical protein